MVAAAAVSRLDLRTRRRARRRVLRRRLAIAVLVLATLSVVGGFLAFCLMPGAVR
jgi:hypothetical protein